MKKNEIIFMGIVSCPVFIVETGEKSCICMGYDLGTFKDRGAKTN